MAFLLLFFQLLDQLVERFDHAALDLLYLLARTPQIQPAADVAHPPGDVVQAVVLQALQVLLHQPGQRHVASWALLLTVEQPLDGLQARLLLEQRMIGRSLAKQQQGRGNHVAGVEIGDLLQRFVEQLLMDQPAAVEQTHVVGQKRRRFRIGQPGLVGQ